MIGTSEIRLVDGVDVDDTNFKVGVFDPGFYRGDGVFEVVRIYAGRSWALGQHLDRLDRSASALHLPYDRGALLRECLDVVARTSDRDAVIRIIVTRKGTRFIATEPNVSLSERLGLLAVEHLVSPIISGVKSLSYAANMHANRLAREAGLDDALFISALDGRVLEGCTSTFVWERDGKIHTPPLSDGILDSITRRALLECSNCDERICRTEDLLEADGACMAGTGIELRPIARIAGRYSREFSQNSPALLAAAKTLKAYIQSHLDEAGSGRPQRTGKV